MEFQLVTEQDKIPAKTGQRGTDKPSLLKERASSRSASSGKKEEEKAMSRSGVEKRASFPTVTFIELAGGLIVREDVLAWMIDKDLDGVTFLVRNSRIYPEPLSALTDADIAFLKAHRTHVEAIASYEAPSRPAGATAKVA